MHYLEDYLELLDPLPEILREKLTLMRENDLKIQADLTQLEEDASKFLTNYRLYQQQSSLSPTRSKIKIQTSAGQEEPVNNQEPPLTAEQLAAQQQKQIEYEKIVERHEQLIKASNAKITLANESHEIVERYYKKLENDLNKFKMELEADYSGITETLEKRFASERFNEYDNPNGDNGTFDTSLFGIEPLMDPIDDLNLSGAFNDDFTNQTTLSSWMMSQSRRLSGGLMGSLASLFNRKQGQQRLASNSNNASRGRKRLQGTSTTNSIGKHRKRTGARTTFLNDSLNSQGMGQMLAPSDSDESSSASNLQASHTGNEYFQLNNQTASPNLFDDETNVGFDGNHVLSNFPSQTIDDRRYCFCNEMSYGEMIACDNANCRREWFHYPCVGIVTPPKGKWFCSECLQQQQQQLQSQISTTKRASTT